MTTMSGKTNPWAKPELLVLVRSEPEEAVLSPCKTTAASPQNGPGVGNDGCKAGIVGNCGQYCDTHADS
jgi:hypothetical protein